MTHCKNNEFRKVPYVARIKKKTKHLSPFQKFSESLVTVNKIKDILLYRIYSQIEHRFEDNLTP
jgi:hypothetical protein